MANPKFVTLSADAEATVNLDANYGEIRITVLSNPAVVYFNTANAAIGSVTAGGTDGNEALPAVLCSRVVRDQTGGANSVVRLRSTGTPTLLVGGVT